MKDSIKYYFSVLPVDTPEIKVRGIGIREFMRPCAIDRPTGSGDFLIMLFYDEAIISASNSEKLYPPNSLMIWSKGSRQYYGNKKMKWSHSWVHCDGKQIERHLKKEKLPFNKPLMNINPAVVEKYLLDLHNELHNEYPDPLIVTNLFHCFFREISRMTSFKGRRAAPAEMLKIRWRLETSFREKITLSKLAREAGISVPHLCSQFKKYFGVPPVEYLLSLRMKHASYLLSDINLRVNEVAAEVGYEDIFYFSRLFKKRIGLSPIAFRKNLR